jgi:hypothetical protein
MKRILILVVGLLLLGANVYAASGDLIVNGNLGVGTSTPSQKAEINGNLKVDGSLCVGSSCTSTLHVSGGLYGYCLMGVSQGLLSPAYLRYGAYGDCLCPAGYTLIQLGIQATDGYQIWSCYKN